jgi:hypothetical protein
LAGVRYAWIAVIAITGAPLVAVVVLANPLVVITLGVDRWREQVVARLVPYRWWLLFLIGLCAFASTVYLVHYG